MIYKCQQTQCRKMFTSFSGNVCPFCESKEVEPAQELDRQQFEKGVESCKSIMNALNTMSGESAFNMGFVNEVNRTHRTLQQNFGGLLKGIIAHFASQDKPGWYDARNEGTVKMCSKINGKIKDEYLPFI